MEGTWSKMWCGALCAVLLLAAAGTANARASAFCETSVIHNYEKPLEAMPPIRASPERERLPFGPGNLFFGTIGIGPVAVGSQEVGYAMTYSRTAPHPTGSKLGWLVTAKLDRVDATRRVTEPVAFEQVDGVRFPSKHQLAFKVSSKPALYRIEAVFRDGSGKRLGRYGRYLRVVQMHSEKRLALPQTSYRVGETVAPRLENEGTDTLFYGLGYAVDKFDGINWAPTSLGPEAFLLIGLYSFPGEAASCWPFTVPAEAQAGEYRLRLSVTTYKALPIRKRPHASFLTAEFEVEP
jgi:hypothetical protein